MKNPGQKFSVGDFITNGEINGTVSKVIVGARYYWLDYCSKDGKGFASFMLSFENAKNWRFVNEEPENVFYVIKPKFNIGQCIRRSEFPTEKILVLFVDQQNQEYECICKQGCLGGLLTISFSEQNKYELCDSDEQQYLSDVATVLSKNLVSDEAKQAYIEGFLRGVEFQKHRIK